MVNTVNSMGIVPNGTTSSAFGNIFESVVDVAGKYFNYDLQKTAMKGGYMAPQAYTSAPTESPVTNPGSWSKPGTPIDWKILAIIGVVAALILKG